MSAARGRRRKVHEEEHVNHERWMVTYADMLTLLLVLFIVLYAISQVNTSKFNELKTSLSSAFGNGQSPVINGGTGPIDGNTVSVDQSVVDSKLAVPNPAAAKQPLNLPTNSDANAALQELDEFKKIEQAIKASLARRGLSGSAEFNIDERGLVVTLITDELVFTGNSAVLEPEGAVILDAVSPALVKIDNQIQVDGHTNQQNVSTAPYPSGWELSSARASSVVRYLIGHGHLAASRLSAAGYSDQRPLLPPSDPRSITRNRRVDIVVLSKLPASARGSLVALAAGTGS
ncbi:MAG TPA: flagellar motor protein MotB [Jatrophihabitans sp.]|nr:flagellar motor protein MotB [Jatrophihabitans sp.]